MKRELRCPNCGKTFQVATGVYESIVEQVRNRTFSEELDRRMAEAEVQFKSREEAVRLRVEKDFGEKEASSAGRIAELEKELTRLSGIIKGYDSGKESEIITIKAQKDRELFDAIKEKETEFADAIREKEKRISELESRLDGKDNEMRIGILEEKNANEKELRLKETEILELRAQIKSDKLSAENNEARLREMHKQQLDDKQAEIDRLKDFRLRLSTKMVGETLEQHCAITFEHAQSMGQFPNATFDKDNTAVEHSKGDFIFRDFIDGKEYVSVMFEMKNEMDATATKHRNDDFLDKLDKDRSRKNCEYAVLISMLEQGNELYDQGIVDKSHRYRKMMVIRPQFFLPVLRLISEAARKGFTERLQLQQELAAARNQTLDFAKFEDKLNRFRTQFNSNVTAAHKKFTAATEGIDKTIEALEKQIKALRDIKASFEVSEQKLMKANEIADENLTVKKLTYGNPTIRRMIDEARED